MSDHRQEKRLTRTEESREEEGRQQPEAPESFKGYRLCDPLGRKIGCVEKLFDNGEGNPQYVLVKMGFFGLRSVLIPVESVAVDEPRRVLTLE